MDKFVICGDQAKAFYKFFSWTFIFFKYFLAIEINLCIMPLFMQFYGWFLCPAATGAGLQGIGGGTNQKVY